MTLRRTINPQEKGAAMRSVLRSVRKRKKSRRLGAVAIINREEYAGFDVDAKVEMIRALVPLGLMHVQELLDDEVTALAGARHARKEPGVQGRRHGSNPGTVRLAGQRVPMRVPRVRSVAGGEIPLRAYEAARGDGQVHDVLLKRVALRHLLPQLRGGGRVGPRGDWLVELHGVSEFHPSQCGNAPGVSGAGPVR
jgi:hypothetical protein